MSLPLLLLPLYLFLGPLRYGSTMERPSCRLPDTVVPVKYSLLYDDLDLDRCTFTGQIVIDCQVPCCLVALTTAVLRAHCKGHDKTSTEWLYVAVVQYEHVVGSIIELC